MKSLRQHHMLVGAEGDFQTSSAVLDPGAFCVFLEPQAEVFQCF